MSSTTLKVIFLDFDGPLVPYKSENLKRRPALADWGAIHRLNVIACSSGASVVVSSSWRKLHDISALGKLLKGWGFIGEVCGKTWNSDDGRRGGEIKEWLAQNRVASFVIIDDEDTDIDGDLRPRLVKTSSMEGISWADVLSALKILAMPCRK